jgi:hypothetical protein
MPSIATATVDQLNVIIILFVNLGLYNKKLIFAVNDVVFYFPLPFP